jgi:hypothetical protein
LNCHAGSWKTRPGIWLRCRAHFILFEAWHITAGCSPWKSLIIFSALSTSSWQVVTSLGYCVINALRLKCSLHDVHEVSTDWGACARLCVCVCVCVCARARARAHVCDSMFHSR